MFGVCLQSFMYQLCKGLADCHSYGVKHMCVKLLLALMLSILFIILWYMIHILLCP